MAGEFARSWQILKICIDVMKKDKELLLFPLLGGLFSILFIVAIFVPAVVVGSMLNTTEPGIFEYVVLFLVYLGLSFIATFFNTCAVHTIKTRFEGGNATFRQSIGFAFSMIHLIFAWSLLSATVGIIFRILENMAQRMKGVGQILFKLLISALGMMWGIITLFVVPAMVYHNLGPIDAIKKSVQTLKKTWGESIIRHFGLGLAQIVFVVIGIIVGIGLFVLALSLGGYALMAVIAVIVLYFLCVVLFFGLANVIFNTALYVYAETGQVPEGYDKDVMKNAFQPTQPA
mgnify:CR=1 FL=1